MPQHPTSSSDAPGSTEPSRGRVIADNRLLEPIAVGDRISCWRAETRNGDATTVHLIRADSSSGERMQFSQAAARLAALARQNPIVGVVHVLVVLPNDHAYVATGSVSGTMADLPVLNWRLSDRLAFVRRLMGAVAALHALSVIHGCLCPGNVLLGNELNPLVSDAGAISLAESFPAATQHDYAAFAALEVRLGDQPSVRSDIFSLGRLLHFALLGQEPDEPDEDVPLLETLAEQPAGLVNIIRRCTLQDPGRRYASVEEMLDDFARHGRAESVGVDVEAESRVPEEVALARFGGDGASGSGANGHESELSGEARTQRKLEGLVAADVSLLKTKNKLSHEEEQERRADKEVARERAARQRATEPTRTRPAPTTDPLGDKRGVIGGGIGLVVLILALGSAYLLGNSSMATTVGSIVGAALFSLLLPPLFTGWLSRPLFAGAFAGAVLWFEPSVYWAQQGMAAQFDAADGETRGAMFQHRYERGERDFAALNLRERRAAL